MVGGVDLSKQDRSGVRTAQDLERKYPLNDLVGMKKAIKQTEEGITKTNKILESYVNSVLMDADNIQAQTDGEVTTWFSHGEPTLASEPTTYWTTDEQKEAHTGDLYYDRDTGYAYAYELVDGEYKWSIVTDTATIESLSLANSFYDTNDNKRRVFVAQPYPPYENGDLWFDGTDIFICQISKSATNLETGEAEVYAEGDFIIATKYTDDTIANQVGEKLEVLEGTVLTVIESADQFKAEVYDRDEKTQSSLELLEQSLKTLIKGRDGQSLMTQTENGWEFSIESIIDTVDKAVEGIEKLEGDTEKTLNELEEVKTAINTVSKVASYLRFYEIDGEPYLELGTNANGFKSVHTNKGIQFAIGDDVQTEITHEGMEIEKAIIREELKVGGFLLKERANGNVGFVWRGDE
jgi:phage-related protein